MLSGCPLFSHPLSALLCPLPRRHGDIPPMAPPELRSLCSPPFAACPEAVELVRRSLGSKRGRGMGRGGHGQRSTFRDRRLRDRSERPRSGCTLSQPPDPATPAKRGRCSRTDSSPRPQPACSPLLRTRTTAAHASFVDSGRSTDASCPRRCCLTPARRLCTYGGWPMCFTIFALASHVSLTLPVAERHLAPL